MAKQQRRIVYFLGAGASLGAGANTASQGKARTPILVQDTFWETFLKLCKRKKNRRAIESLLFRYFLGYAKVPPRSSDTSRRKLLQPIDVEEVFTFLSERNNAPTVPSQARQFKVWDSLVEEVGQVFSRFRANKQTKKVYGRFKRQHLRSRDTVVSFNYDIVFELSIPANTFWHYGGVVKNHKRISVKVLKPHGSINWEADKHGAITAKSVSSLPANPVIVAPTHLKFVVRPEPNAGHVRGYINQSEQVDAVWGSMEKEMREAKSWIFIGYSFPSSDLYFSSVLRSALAVRNEWPFVVIVNPDSMAISNRLQSRFSIPKDKIRTFADLQSFNQVDRSQVLKMF